MKMLKTNKKIQSRLEKEAEELIFDIEDNWDFLDRKGLAVSDDECGVDEGIWNLVMDALIRGYYIGKETKSEEGKARHSSQA